MQQLYKLLHYALKFSNSADQIPLKRSINISPRFESTNRDPLTTIYDAIENVLIIEVASR